MSYARMDHAEWVEKNNAAMNRMWANKRGWKPLPEKLTQFQAQVADILGMVGGGIYNAPIAHDRTRWDADGWGYVSVTWRHPLATWDGFELTLLVLLCHVARIRCQVEPAGPRLLRISFWPRTAKGDTTHRHPDVAGAVEWFDRYLPADHRIRQPRPAKEQPDAS